MLRVVRSPGFPRLGYPAPARRRTLLSTPTFCANGFPASRSSLPGRAGLAHRRVRVDAVCFGRCPQRRPSGSHSPGRRQRVSVARSGRSGETAGRAMTALIGRAAACIRTGAQLSRAGLGDCPLRHCEQRDDGRRALGTMSKTARPPVTRWARSRNKVTPRKR